MVGGWFDVATSFVRKDKEKLNFPPNSTFVLFRPYFFLDGFLMPTTDKPTMGNEILFRV